MEMRLKPGQHVLAALRRMIISGEIRDGERIAEIPTAARLGVSRMPVRTALRTLEREGLVVRLGARGYAARTATLSQIEGAIEVRGVLEGLAAHLVTGQAHRADIVRNLRSILAEGDRIFAGTMDADAVDLFYAYNRAFHEALIVGSGNEAIAVALARNDHLPFAAASAMAFDWRDHEWEREHLLTAHRQHGMVLAAILAGDAGAAERHMRDHARISLESVGRFDHLGVDLTEVARRVDSLR